MIEIRRGNEAYGSAGGERLPWLEPVEDEDGVEYGAADAGGGYGGVLLAAIAVLIGIALLTAVVVWWRHHRAATADIGQIIHAPAEPYRVKPADPGGMKADGNGEVTYGTSNGQDFDSPLDLAAMPEQPIAKAPAPAPAAAPAPAPASAAPAPASAPAARTSPPAAQPAPPPVAIKPPPVATPAPRMVPVKPPVVVNPDSSVTIAGDASAAPSGPNGTIQLGAFSTEAKASAVWKTMAQRFAYLRGLEKMVVPVESDGKTLYRLRASGAGASGLCARLRVAGETCSGVGG